MIRDKSHKDFIERWVVFMRENKDWKKYQNAFIDAQFAKAYEVIGKVLQEKDGKEKVAGMYNIKNLNAYPKLFGKKERIKKCVGAVIYDNSGNIFLMTSPKWKKWVVPGGRIEEGESEEDALHREIQEELGIKITDLVRVGEKIKKPGKDFIDPELTFYFIDYFARALQIGIDPNNEITTWGWFTIEEALQLPLADTLVRDFILQFQDFYKKQSAHIPKSL